MTICRLWPSSCHGPPWPRVHLRRPRWLRPEVLQQENAPGAPPEVPWSSCLQAPTTKSRQGGTENSRHTPNFSLCSSSSSRSPCSPGSLCSTCTSYPSCSCVLPTFLLLPLIVICLLVLWLKFLLLIWLFLQGGFLVCPPPPN